MSMIVLRVCSASCPESVSRNPGIKIAELTRRFPDVSCRFYLEPMRSKMHNLPCEHVCGGPQKPFEQLGGLLVEHGAPKIFNMFLRSG